MVSIYKVIKEKSDVNKDMCWIPEYLKLPKECLEA